jgi:CheY-like chemotaxis protein
VVTSQPGKGSLFALTVRLSRMHAVSTNGIDAPIPAPSVRRTVPDVTETPDQADACLKAGFTGTRLLLAEDEATNQLVTQAIIEAAGLVVDIAADGQQAVMMAKNTPYALIMIAPKIPMLNGADTTRAIRLLPGYAQTPILALTAATDWKDCRDAGMNDRLEKPVVPDRLYQILLKWLA